jgi:acetylornithine deacetylase
MPDKQPRIDAQRLRQLLRKMVDIYSPSGKERDLVNFLYGYLRRHGFPVIRQQVDEDRENLVIEPDDIEPELLFLGHIDTVEAYDLGQYGFRQDKDEIYGLGTADMKSGCAAMIEAFLALWESGYTKLPIALALVVGEEDTGDGTRRLVREFDFNAAIVGEPTNLAPCLTHYGYLEMQLLTTGRRVHASMARQTSNPIHAMLQLLQKIINYLDEKRPEAVYNIRNLASSSSGFAVPEQCEAWLDIHLPPLTDLGSLTLELEEHVSTEGASFHPVEASVYFNTIHDGYRLPPKGALVEMVEQAYQRLSIPFEPASFPSHSDANLLWGAGVKSIILGPGLLDKAHTAEESVSFAQVIQAAQLYLEIAMSYVSDRT